MSSENVGRSTNQTVETLIHQQVVRNRILSVVVALVVLSNAGLIAILAYGFTKSLGAAAAVFGSVGVFIVVGLLVTRRTIPRSLGARPPRDEEQRVLTITAAVAEKYGIPAPTAWIIDDDSPNALAVGRPGRAEIGYTTGILELLDDDELEAVAAHEMAHVAGKDTLILSFSNAVLKWALIVELLIEYVAGVIVEIGKRIKDERDSAPDPSGGLISLAFRLTLYCIAAFVFLFGQIWFAAARLTHLALIRQREWHADSAAAEALGTPEHLAAALEALDESDTRLSRGGDSVQALCIAGVPQLGGWWENLTHTHPNTGARIRRLQNAASGRPGGTAGFVVSLFLGVFAMLFGVSIAFGVAQGADQPSTVGQGPYGAVQATSTSQGGLSDTSVTTQSGGGPDSTTSSAVDNVTETAGGGTSGGATATTEVATGDASGGTSTGSAGGTSGGSSGGTNGGTSGGSASGSVGGAVGGTVGGTTGGTTGGANGGTTGGTNGGTAGGSAGGTSGGNQTPPRITGVTTYQEGPLIYLSVSYSDADNDAQGFGFAGANGSGWSKESHPFSSPSYGRVSPGRVDYPFNHGCGTANQIQTDVAFWIYDAEGQQSPSVVTHLACAPSATVPTTPGSVTATALDQRHIKVTWTDASGTATGFNVDNGCPVGSCTPGATLAQTTTVPTATFTTTPGAYQCFRVQAFNSAGSSGWSGYGCTTTPAFILPASQPWADTGVDVAAGTTLTVRATGTLNIDPATTIGPAGNQSCVPDQTYPGANPPFLAPGLHCWSLVARIGNDTPFEVDSMKTVTATAGRLYLSVNDSYFADNSGSWTVGIKFGGQ